MGDFDSSNEVRSLRKQGQLREAYNLAKELLNDKPDDIWFKRDFAWVCYDLMKKAIEDKNSGNFISRLEDIISLDLPPEEQMLYNQLPWVFGKWVVAIFNSQADLLDQEKIKNLYSILNYLSELYITIPSDGYSFFVKKLHKSFKGDLKYCDIIDSTGLNFFLPEDYEKTSCNGKNFMSFVEQVYIAYSDCLISNISHYEAVDDKDKVKEFTAKVEKFLPKLNDLIENHNDYEFPIYFKAKILLAIHENDKVADLLMPFVKTKANVFWTWQALGDAFLQRDDDIALSCYCKGLLCRNKEGMIVNLRDSAAELMAEKGFYDEAKTEFSISSKTRMQNWQKIDRKEENAKTQSWYKDAKLLENNINFYNSHSSKVDSLLFAKDSVTVLITYVNTSKGFASFLTDDDRSGFFRYTGIINQELKEGDLYNVDFQQINQEAPSKIAWGKKSKVDPLKTSFYRVVSGVISIKAGNRFGFLDENFVDGNLISKMQLADGMQVNGIAIKSYNKKKDSVGWKLISVENN